MKKIYEKPAIDTVEMKFEDRPASCTLSSVGNFTIYDEEISSENWVTIEF